MPGADLGNNVIKKEIRNLQKLKNIFFYESLGQRNYFSFLNQVDAPLEIHQAVS